MYCCYCGKALFPGAAFCYTCGRWIGIPSILSAVAEAIEEVPEKPDDTDFQEEIMRFLETLPGGIEGLRRNRKKSISRGNAEKTFTILPTP